MTIIISFMILFLFTLLLVHETRLEKNLDDSDF